MLKRALMVFVIVAFALPIGQAFAIPESRMNRPNSLGVEETYQNPVTYLVGLPVDGKILDDKYTNIRFKPYAASALYDVTVLFCGDITEQFDGKQGVLVITYYKQASGKYEGIGCHDLVSVFTGGK